MKGAVGQQSRASICWLHLGVNTGLACLYLSVLQGMTRQEPKHWGEGAMSQPWLSVAPLRGQIVNFQTKNVQNHFPNVVCCAKPVLFKVLCVQLFFWLLCLPVHPLIITSHAAASPICLC